MKTIIQIAALSTLLSVSTLYAGGKFVAPAVSPVAEVVEEDTNPFYVGIGILWAHTSRDCICYDLQGEPRIVIEVDDSNWGGIIRLGYDFNQYIGLEGRFLSATIGDGFFDTKHYGIYLKPMMPLDEQMNIYGLLGYGHTEIDTDCGTLAETFKHNGFSYGIGLEYDLSSKEDDYESYKKNPTDAPQFDRPFDGHGDQEVGWGLWVDYQKLLRDEGPANFNSYVVTFGVTYDF